MKYWIVFILLVPAACSPTNHSGYSQEEEIEGGEYTGPFQYDEVLEVDEHGFTPSDYKRPVLVWLEPLFEGPVNLNSAKPLLFRFRIENRSAEEQVFSIDRTCGFWLYYEDGKTDLRPPQHHSEDPEWLIVPPGETMVRKYDLRRRFTYAREFHHGSIPEGDYDMSMLFALKGHDCRTPSNLLKIRMVL